MQVMVNGLLVNYHVGGTGPLVLVLHGWGDESKNWRKVSERLGKHFRVLIPDLPGFGGSDTPTQAWGLDEYAQFVHDFLQKLELSTPEAIIGHSNGGAIVIRGLSTGALQSDKLILLASAGIRNEYKGRKKAIRLVAKAGKGLTKPLPKSVTHRLRRRLYTSIGSDMLVAEHMQETFKQVVNDDVQADAKKITIPALLLYGDKDVATPLRYGRKLQLSLPNAHLEVIEDAEHFLHKDQFEVVMKKVEDFIS